MVERSFLTTGVVGYRESNSRLERRMGHTSRHGRSSMGSCLTHYEQLLYLDISVDMSVCTNQHVYLHWLVLYAEGTSQSCKNT